MTRQQITQEFLLVAASMRFISAPVATGGYAFSSVDGFVDAEVHLPGRRAVGVARVGGELRTVPTTTASPVNTLRQVPSASVRWRSEISSTSRRTAC